MLDNFLVTTIMWVYRRMPRITRAYYVNNAELLRRMESKGHLLKSERESGNS